MPVRDTSFSYIGSGSDTILYIDVYDCVGFDRGFVGM